MKLTAANIRGLGLPEGKTETIIWDSELPGFGLRLRQGTAPSYVVQYRVGRKQRRMKLGSQATLTPAEARERARKLLGKVANKEDPVAQRAEQRASTELTLGVVAEKFLAHREQMVRTGQRRQRSHEELSRRLLKGWKPLLARPLAAIRLPDVAARIDDLERTSGPVAARHARAALGQVYSWSLRRGLTDHNPVVGSAAPETSSRDRVLSDGELVEIWNATDSDNDYDSIVRLLMLTGQRRQEVAGVRFDEVDFDAKVFVIPPERSKNKRAHIVPLSGAALDILRSVPRRLGTDFLFGMSATSGFSNWSWNKARLDEKLGDAVKPFVLHDLRRSAVTKMADIGVQPHIIESVINHVSGHKAGVAGVYNKSAYGPEKRQALDLWAAHLADLVAGRVGNVTVLRKA